MGSAPRFQSEEGENTGDSVERLIARRDYKAVAALCEDGSIIPRSVLPGVDALRLGTILVKRGLHLQPDGDAESDYWYVERIRAAPRAAQARRQRGAFPAVKA